MADWFPKQADSDLTLLFSWSKERWSNDKTMIEIGYRRNLWFVSVSQIIYLPQPSTSANNWSAHHWQVMILCLTPLNNHGSILGSSVWCSFQLLQFPPLKKTNIDLSSDYLICNLRPQYWQSTNLFLHKSDLCSCFLNIFPISLEWLSWV